MKNLVVFYTYLFLSAHFHLLETYETTESSDFNTLQSENSEVDSTILKLKETISQLGKLKDVEFVVTLILGSLAVASNILILVVTVHYKFIGIAQVYMTVLAICDLCIGIFSSWRLIADRVYYWSDGLFHFCAYTYWPVSGLEAGASTTASLIAMTLSVDRCFACKYPVKHAEVCSVRKAKVLSVVVGLLSFVIGLNYPLRIKVIKRMSNELNMVPSVFTTLGQDPTFVKVSAYTEFFFRFAVPFAVMTVANTWTIAIIRKSDMFRRSMDKETRSAVNTPKCLTMTVGLVIIFFITQLPKAAFLLDSMIFSRAHRGTIPFETFVIFGNIFTRFNSVVNIFVYLSLNKEFRCTLIKVLKVCKTTNVEISTMATASTQTKDKQEDPVPSTV
ncbi:hypothetical protein CAPTEDRAFT_214160 [Capitella teleta]|uniref:G-protein coupled receptors family 1 profile domain-containing protein n=1 Tax=Capitella teleta TaxID=283909 RepID=R7TL19_CAPTE|nr:hypothetical protein CAPTEDRAFT_214160 [Capitella teleta]|eukprot:ELT94217.1 hypothetical protein CAPTEDRAFT_214160 [Capitella teleta]